MIDKIGFVFPKIDDFWFKNNTQGSLEKEWIVNDSWRQIFKLPSPQPEHSICFWSNKSIEFVFFIVQCKNRLLFEARQTFNGTRVVTVNCEMNKWKLAKQWQIKIIIEILFTNY